MKYFYKKLVSKATVGFLTLVLFGCAPEVTNHKKILSKTGGRNLPQTQANHPSARPSTVPESSPQESAGSSVANLNHLIGRWQLNQIWDANLASPLSLMRDELTSRTSIIWTFRENLRGTLEFTRLNQAGSPSCQARIDFTFRYCCQSMHRLFVNKPQNSLTMTPANCMPARDIWVNEIFDTYHFVYDSAASMEGQVLLQGPYRDENPEANFSSTLRINRLED